MITSVILSYTRKVQHTEISKYKHHINIIMDENHIITSINVAKQFNEI